MPTSSQQGIRVPTANQAGVRHARFQTPEYHINVSPQQQQFNTPTGSSSPVSILVVINLIVFFN